MSACGFKWRAGVRLEAKLWTASPPYEEIAEASCLPQPKDGVWPHYVPICAYTQQWRKQLLGECQGLSDAKASVCVSPIMGGKQATPVCVGKIIHKFTQSNIDIEISKLRLIPIETQTHMNTDTELPISPDTGVCFDMWSVCFEGKKKELFPKVQRWIDSKAFEVHPDSRLSLGPPWSDWPLLNPSTTPEGAERAGRHVCVVGGYPTILSHFLSVTGAHSV
eukprot:GHVR01060030.1.p1 GENE.GHVR01060030.1~~GHVR01060030.1.p1  ORF type:complete len:221 (+),score=52.10 GHVR01060030.1:212-874(+)